ncbi:NAD(P)H-binding protein [Allokutzneria sp. A3M-2-11 16]|uniref:NmrA family NAD(P)-binding protein n=1 Tax=Allokutzneria sp. A3M-2-11 16 TaxID=2962043 RepID=UPI0020B8DD1A|nr:NAD(P)H-binding protein [Allokutzneria sp. A3M-2-11 16]MCP3800619.1 NAD(P)H-binding protein [Allokutzneria sp. A3M-2-11 16]
MTILVTGATGNVGRGVVAQLLDAGQAVRAVTRNPATANLPAGVEVVRGDLADLPAEAFAGVERMFLFPANGSEAVATAVRVGVRRIVVLSSMALDDATDDTGPAGYHHAEELAAERAVQASGLEWTVVRPGEFMANALGWADAIRAGEVVRAPSGDVPGMPVDEIDTAAVAVAALLEDGHSGATYEVTGPELITPAEQVRVIGEVIGRDIGFVALSEEETAEYWRSFGVPQEMIDWFASLEETATDPLKTVENVVGRPGSPFSAWAQRHAPAFR